jgi:D-alanyl-D-alanine carboxypeptidase
MPARARVLLSLLAMAGIVGGSLAPTAPASGASGSLTERAIWLPPAYLMWRTGGLPPGLTPKLARLAGVRRSVVVADDTLWMTRSVRGSGAVVESAPLPYRIPIEVMATDARAMAPFLPGAWRTTVYDVLRAGDAVMGETSASIRRLGVGDRLVFKGRDRLTVGAIVPDEVASWSELMVSRSVGARIGIRHDRFALLQMGGSPTQPQLARRIAHLLGPGYPPRVREPGNAEFRRQGDSVWPPVLMKAGFGEFSAYPDPRRPGYLRMNPSFVHRHLASRTVPLLGRFTCHEEVFPALIRAMKQLRRQGHGRAIRNFAGCYNARMVLRRPSGAISHHSWGAAVDINSITNPYGAVPHQPPSLVHAMRVNGFTWGGRWTVPDGMHFEFVGTAGVTG